MYPKMRQGIGAEGSVGAGATTAFRTVAGQRRSIDLPDGSRVTLAATSSLRTLPNYGSGAREVELTGEAMFSVTHDEARPFRVHVGSTIVEDLGTEFAVRAVAGEASIRIAVAAGSVAVRGESLSPVVLTPRDVALVSQLGSGADTVVVSHDVDVNRFTAFSLGRLMFVDTPLSQVAIDLSRWYGVTVRITDTALLDRHLTSTFEAETLDEVLRIIGIALDVKYLRDGQSVEFNGSGAISGGSPSPPSSRREAGA